MKIKDVIRTIVIEQYAAIECEDDETDEETIESLLELDAELQAEHPIANLPDINWVNDGESTSYRVFHED